MDLFKGDFGEINLRKEDILEMQSALGTVDGVILEDLVLNPNPEFENTYQYTVPFKRFLNEGNNDNRMSSFTFDDKGSGFRYINIRTHISIHPKFVEDEYNSKIRRYNARRPDYIDEMDLVPMYLHTEIDINPQFLALADKDPRVIPYIANVLMATIHLGLERNSQVFRKFEFDKIQFPISFNFLEYGNNSVDESYSLFQEGMNQEERKDLYIAHLQSAIGFQNNIMSLLGKVFGDHSLVGEEEIKFTFLDGLDEDGRRFFTDIQLPTDKVDFRFIKSRINLVDHTFWDYTVTLFGNITVPYTKSNS